MIFSVQIVGVGQLSAAESPEELLAQYQNSQSNNTSEAKQVAVSQQQIFAQQSSEITSVSQQAKGLPEKYQQNLRNGLLLPGETDISALLPIPEHGLAPPYGANIFAGGYESERVDGLNEDYLIASGDKISIWLWGATNYSDVTTVDNQGNIFIPNVGPVHVANVRASQVNDYVTSKIRTVYKSSVKIYVNLLTATPVTVFITGGVLRPGQYAGMASDSVLYYLKRAGGIDSERGSYRDIQIIRKGEVVQKIDLYRFIKYGQLDPVNFKDSDVIFVSEQKSVINVGGGVKNPFRFEFVKEQITGQELIDFVKPLSKTSHVAISGNRESGPFSVYLAINEFNNYQIRNGDKLFFNDDLHAQIYDIQIAGSYLGPSYFAVSKKTKLYDLLSYIQIEPALADNSSIYILRQSVAKKQKEILDRSLDRLERSIYASPASSTGEAQIRAQEAKLISEFIARAREVVPLGKVIVSDNGNVANISLEQGDTIVIPAKTDLIQIGGEVLMPQAVVYNEQASVEDYIAWAGGYTNRANYEDIVLVHSNGLTEFVNVSADGSWLSSGKQTKLAPGDQIIVLPRVEAKTMQTIKDMTQIIYQIAVAANVITRD